MIIARSAATVLLLSVFAAAGASAQETSGFGTRKDPFHGGRAKHSGIDLASPAGTPIYATADAVVGRAQWAGGYGNLVELNHGNGYQTRYAHMLRILVAPGQYVRKGMVVGLVGSTGRSTGNHLHYEVRFNGKPMNPKPYMDAGSRGAVTPRAAAPAPRVGFGRVAMGGPAER